MEREKKLTTRECAEIVQKNLKTIDRWIKVGFGKHNIKLAATREGRAYLVNPSTFDVFRWKIRKLYEKDVDKKAA